MKAIDWGRVTINTALLALIVAVIALAARLDASDVVDTVVQVVGGFLAALFGALAAFWLQARRDDVKQKNAELAEINLLTLSFISRIDLLRGIRKQHLDPIRTAYGRQLMVRPLRAPWPTHQVNFPVLSALLSEDLAPYVVEIAMLDQQYQMAREAVELHGELHLEFQSLMSQSHLAGVMSPLDDEIRKVIGEKLWQSLEHAFRQMVEGVDGTFISLQNFLTAFPAKFKVRHPNSKVLAYIDVGPDATGTGWI